MLFGRKKKNPIKLADKGAVDWKYTTCGYCSTGCSIEVGLNADGKAVSARGVGDADVNRGKLCISLSITGQCNAMGTREWSSCSGLPGYRTLEKEQDRREIAEYWGIYADFFPDKRGLFIAGSWGGCLVPVYPQIGA